MTTKKTLFSAPHSEKPHNAGAGIQKIYKFDNGFGASVVRFRTPLGLSGYGSYTNNEKEWELAVIKFGDGDNYSLTYDTEITKNVLGHLKEEAVEEYLQKIKALKTK